MICIVACSEPEQFKNCSQYNGTWYNQTCWTLDQHGSDTFNFFEQLVNQTGRKSASYEYFQWVFTSWQIESITPILFQNSAGKSCWSMNSFYSEKVLDITDNITTLGAPQWQLVLSLLGAWVIVFLCLVKGIKSSGKVNKHPSVFIYLFSFVCLTAAILQL